MTSTKKHHQNRGSQAKLSSQPIGHTKTSALKLPSHTTKAALPAHDVSRSHSVTKTGGQTPSTSQGAKSDGGNNPRRDAARKSTQESTKLKRWTIEAASRVASASAKKGDGEVKKGTFAADAMSKAMKNAHNLKGEK